MKSVHFVLAVAAIAAGGLTACPPNPDFPEIKDIPAACAKACSHFADLDCEEAKPTNGGISCTQVCVNMQESGLISYDLACAATVTSCEAISACPRK